VDPVLERRLVLDQVHPEARELALLAHLWASAISTRPALLLEGVVDEPGAGHRLDDGAYELSVNLVDSPRERWQRIDVGWDGELVDVLSLAAEQADVELAPTEI
jgi:hypothetical protein